MHQLRSRGVDWKKIWLGQGHVSWPIFLANFRIFGILGFESRFLPADRGDHSQYPGEAFERLGHRSGAQSWPYFSTFVLRVVVVVCLSIFRIFGFIGFEDL